MPGVSGERGGLKAHADTLPLLRLMVTAQPWVSMSGHGEAVGCGGQVGAVGVAAGCGGQLRAHAPMHSVASTPANAPALRSRGRGGSSTKPASAVAASTVLPPPLTAFPPEPPPPPPLCLTQPRFVRVAYADGSKNMRASTHAATQPRDSTDTPRATAASMRAVRRSVLSAMTASGRHDAAVAATTRGEPAAAVAPAAAPAAAAARPRRAAAAAAAPPATDAADAPAAPAAAAAPAAPASAAPSVSNPPCATMSAAAARLSLLRKNPVTKNVRPEKMPRSTLPLLPPPAAAASMPSAARARLPLGDGAACACAAPALRLQPACWPPTLLPLRTPVRGDTGGGDAAAARARGDRTWPGVCCCGRGGAHGSEDGEAAVASGSLGPSEATPRPSPASLGLLRELLRPGDSPAGRGARHTPQPPQDQRHLEQPKPARIYVFPLAAAPPPLASFSLLGERLRRW
eukprot:144929-Chlamydomonas_euryale.AAC.1